MKIWPVMLFAVGTALSARATPEVKLGGVLFAQDVMTTGPRTFAGADAKGRSSFDVTRLYMSADAKFDDHWKAKLLLEGKTTGTNTGGAADTNNTISLKGAWLEYSNLMDLGVNIQGGQIPTSWDTFEAGIHNRRYVIKQFPDNNSLVPTWDKGLSVYGKIPQGYGDYNANFVNGEGVTVTDGATGATGRQKDYSLLLSVVPMPGNDMLKGLRLNGYLQQGTLGQVSTVAGEGLLPSRERNRAFFGASYKNSLFHLMYTYYMAQTATGTTFANNAHSRPKGHSVHGSFSGIPWDLTAFARHDRFDAGVNQASSGAGGPTLAYAPKTTTVLGLEKKFNDNVRFALADIYVSQFNKNTTVKQNENTLGVYAEAKF